MMGSAGALQQQSLLWSFTLEQSLQGEVTKDVHFAEPVLVTGISLLAADTPANGPQPVFKAWARDLHTPAAARFSPLIGAVSAPCEAAAVLQVFPTQHVVLRGRCRCRVTLQLTGYALSSAPEQIKAAAEERLCPLPEVSPQLSLPNPAQQQQQDQSAVIAAAPILPRASGQMLPLRKMPPAFVLILTPLANFWGQHGKTLPLPAGGDVPEPGDMQACEQMATAVLAAKRGNPCAMMAKLTHHVNPKNYAVDWDGIRDPILDMATYCCSAMATVKVNMPDSIELAMAGVCAAILVAACQDTAAQLLTWPGRPRPAAIAITELLSVPHPPQRLQDYGTGLVDILMDSCPTLACSTLQGTLNPATKAPELRPADSAQQAAQRSTRATAARTAKPWQRSPHVAATASGSVGRDLDGSPAKKQRLAAADGGAGGASGTASSSHRRASLTAGAGGSGVVSGVWDDGRDGGRGARRQSDGGVVASDDGGGFAAGAVAAAGYAGDEAGSAGASPIKREPSGDAGRYAAADDEDDGGLYEGLQGEGGQDDVGGDRCSSRSGGSSEGSHRRHGEGSEQGGDDEHFGSQHESDGGYNDGGEDGDGDGLHHGSLHDGSHGGDDAELDFEGTEYTGMHDDDVEGSIGQQEQQGDSEEGLVQESWEGDGQDRQGAGQDSAGEQQYSDQEGGDGGEEQQQQREQWQHDEQPRRVKEEDVEQEDGEYLTDEGNYVEYEEEPKKEEEQAPQVAAPKVQQQPPLPQLYHGQLYNALLKMALSPLHPDAALSCASVLRRLRAYHCLDALQSTVGPMLAGKVNALLLSPQKLCVHVNHVAAAASDLATLVLQPPPGKQSPALKASRAAHGTPLQLQPQRQEADACVLQLLLGFRVLDLLAAFVIYIGVHVCRLVQLQQQLSADLPSAEQQQQQIEIAEQQEELCREHAQLLASIRALTSALTASSGGWSFLTAARDGLAALATAVSPARQVCLDGGPFSPDTSLPYDPRQGWATERTALLAAAAGLGGTPSDPGALLLYGAGSDASADAAAAAAGDLSDSLQRLWLLVEATAELQGSKELLGGSYRGLSLDSSGRGTIDRLNAALLALFKGGFASEVGQQSLVSVLSSCTPALRQLAVLLEQCGKVQGAAVGKVKAEQAPQGLLEDGLEMDHLLMPALERPSLVYGALYAPDILLAVMSSPHADALTTWLPLAHGMAASLKALLAEQERSGPAAAQAAFPDLLETAAAAGGQPQHHQGLPSAIIPGGWEAARQQREQVLWQLHGCVMTGERLLKYWQQAGDGSGSGSGAELLDWLSQQLPPVVTVDDERKLRLPDDVLGSAGGAVAAPDAAVRDAAAAAVAGLDGVAATMGVPPPWGQDVKAEAVVEFMRNAASRSAALCSLHLIDMLLRGAPLSVRVLARRAADRPQQRASMPHAVNPSLSLNPDGSLGPQGLQGCVAVAPQQGVDAAMLRDGFESRELVAELLRAGVLDVLERALRTATVALRGSDADLVWSVQGGSQQDVLSVLQARTAAAALMRAASTTTASLLVHLSDAELKPFDACSLLDAIVGAHSAVATCREGLQACVPHPQLVPFIARASDPSLTPTQRSAADAAVSSAAARVGNSRVLLLLEARQALAVCLRCWQLQGWRPDPVGALLGVFPYASDALETFAKEDAAARKAGDPSAPPPPAPRQGPRQLLSSLLGLADLCPDEWPARGASQAAARHRDAAAAEGVDTLEGSPFERPSLISLRGQLALSLEVHWDRLQALVKFGLSSSTRLTRLALVRMLTRMCGVGGGTPPELGPLVLAALRGKLESIGMARNGLAARLAQIKGEAGKPHIWKQRNINETIHQLVQDVRGAIQVCEVLLPLCSSPSIKSVLTEHKAALLLGKAVSVLAKPLPDLQQLLVAEVAAAGSGPAPVAGPRVQQLGSEVQALSGLLLQLVGVLMDPDISMNPWADSFTRELHDTPAVAVGGKAITWLLSVCEGLNPANMALLAGLLVGPSVAGGTRCLCDYPKGRYLLRMAGRYWHLLATQVAGAAGGGFTQADLQLSGEWAAAALESMQCPTGPDATHAASCAAIAQVLRELSASSMQESEQVLQAETMRPVAGTIPRFVAAIKTATAAHKPGGPDTQSVTNLLSSAPLLLACDASCLDFWKASAASAEHLQANAAPHTKVFHSAAKEAATPVSAQDWWPQTQLVGLPTPRVVSKPIMDVMAVAQTQQQQQQQQQQGRRGGAPLPIPATNSNSIASTGGSAEIPAIMARRGHGPFGKDGSRKISMHVDDFESRQQRRGSQNLVSPPGQGPQGMGPAGVMPAMVQQQPMAAMGMGHAAAAGMGPMGGVMPGMGVGPMGMGQMGAGMAAGPMGQMVPDPSIGTQLLMQHQMLQQQQAMMMGAGMPGMIQQQPQQQQHGRQKRPGQRGRPWRGQH